MARRPRGIFKRPDSSYWWMCIPITIGTRTKYKSESTKQTSLEAAKTVYESRLKEMKGFNSGEPTKEPLTLGGLENYYLSTLIGKPAEASVKAAFKVLRARLGDIPLGTLTPLQIHNYIFERQQTDKVKPATVLREINSFKTALRKALKLDLVSDALALKLLRVETPKPAKGRLRYLTLEETIRLIKCCPPWLQQIVVTAIYTGLRMGEIRSLTWTHFDMAAGYIYLDKTKNGERRHVPLMGTVLDLFKARYREGRRSPFIFSDSQGQPFKRSHIDHEFLDAVHRASIQNFRFHDTRHTFASWAVMGGTEFYAISKLLGHASTKSTEIYTQLSPNHITRQVLLLDGHPDAIKNQQLNTNNFKLLHAYFTFGAGKDDVSPMLFSGLPSAETDVTGGSTDETPDNSDIAA